MKLQAQQRNVNKNNQVWNTRTTGCGTTMAGFLIQYLTETFFF